MKNFFTLFLITLLLISCISDSQENVTEQKNYKELLIGNWIVGHYTFDFPEDNENFEVCGNYSFLANGTYTYEDCQDNSEVGLYNILDDVLTLNSNVSFEEMEIIELKENRAQLKATRFHSGSEVVGMIFLER